MTAMEEEEKTPEVPPAAAGPADSTDDGDEADDQVPPIPSPSAIERSRTEDIGSLLDAGVTMEKLEELYPKKAVADVIQARIVRQREEEAKNFGKPGGNIVEEEEQRRRRGSMARLLFLRSKSTALKEVLRSSAIMDEVLVSLLADPEDEMLMCPLMMAPLKDPVIINSGFVLDRSAALDERGNLRMHNCPFSRVPLKLPVYPCHPIKTMVKEWEVERMNRCIEVAEKMVESQEWERATRVFDIGETLLQEMSVKETLGLARKLSDLERKIPFIENDVERMVKIHQRLLRAAKNDKEETVKVLRQAIKDCCQKLKFSMLSDELEECTKARSEYSKEVLSPTALIDNKAELGDEILELYGLDLEVAKKTQSTSTIWSTRRMILALLEKLAGDDDDKKAKVSEFLTKEGLTGDESELVLGAYDSSRYWPQDKLVDKEIGLVRFDDHNNARDGEDTLSKLQCLVDLNPSSDSDHWVEIAIRPIKLGYPSYKYTIFSQHGSGTGWEIRAGKKTSNDFYHVEALWTTRPEGGSLTHNEIWNKLVPISPGDWYHVVLSVNRSASEVKLYVNGQPESRTVSGPFNPDRRSAQLGQNPEWTDRQFKGMVAYASAESQFPVDYAEADAYVQSLYNIRMEKLRDCAEAMVELDLSAGESGYYNDSDSDY